MPADLPFDLRYEAPGWSLAWARLTAERVDADALAELRAEVAERVGERFEKPADLSSDPTVAALRRLFRDAGCDPTRYRPSSEALARRLVKGDAMPAIHPLVDLGNCLSAELLVPCCVMVEGTFGDQLTMRAGREGEHYESLRGPFNLEGKPLLADQNGPVDTPITGNAKVKVRDETTRAWLVAYLPEGVAEVSEAHAVLEGMGSKVGVGVELFVVG